LKTVLVDASSAILLHKADLLPLVQAVFRLWMTESVYDEVTRRRRPGAQAIARGRRERLITIVSPRSIAGSQRLPAGLHEGERDTLLCFLDGGADFIIIDDGRGAGYCRREVIPYVNALLCPRLLAMAGRLTPTAAQSLMARIALLGRYSEWVKRYAATCSDSALAAFLP